MDNNDLDLSATSAELFPELARPSEQHNAGVELSSAAESSQAVSQDVADLQPSVSQQELNFKALREEVSKAIQEREYWKGRAESQPVKEEQPRHDPLNDIDPEDWAKGKAVKDAFLDMREENRRLKAEIADQLAALNIRSQHSDWKEMVTQHVPELTNKNPIFAEMIDRSSNPYEAAYLLAQLNAGRQQASAKPAIHPDAQRALQNAAKPRSPASVGGHATLSQADMYASMSDEDFMKMAYQNMAGI